MGQTESRVKFSRREGKCTDLQIRTAFNLLVNRCWRSKESVRPDRLKERGVCSKAARPEGKSEGF